MSKGSIRQISDNPAGQASNVRRSFLSGKKRQQNHLYKSIRKK